MDLSSFMKNRTSLQNTTAEDSAAQDYKKSSSSKKFIPMETEQLNPNTSIKNSAGVDIPSLDDMTSYLISNESIGKELLTSQSKQPSEMPAGDNEYEGSQSLSTRTREKSDSSSLPNQSNPDETKREIESLYKKAQILCSAGEFQQAINYYNRIISLNEKSGPAWIAKGHCYGMLGQEAQALATYEQALKMSPSCQKDEQLWFGLALLYQKAGEVNNAEISFRNALRLEPKLSLKAEIFHNLGMILKGKGEYAESIKMLTNAILTGVFPQEKMIEILCQNGHLQEKINDLEGALKTYQYAIMIQENHLESLLHAGWLCFKLDRVEQALSHMIKAESLTPNDGNVIYVIARCHLKLKQHTVAYDFLHKAITKDPTNSIFWASLGILFSELMQLKQAHESFSKALNFNPACPENFFNLGCLFELANQFNDAVSMYDKAIELQPDFVLAINRRKKLLTDSKITSLEVQFKHPPFTFLFPKESTPTLPLPQSGPLNRLHTENTFMEGPKPRIKKDPKEDLLQSKKLGSPDQDISLKPVRLDLLASKLGPQKAASENSYKDAKGIGALGPDVSSLTLSRPKPAESNGTKLPSVQSLSSSIGGLNSFSILQNNFNNVNNFLINPVLDYAKQLSDSDSSLLPSRSKTDELSLKGASTDLVKQLNGLQEILAKNTPSQQASVTQTMSIESLRATKNISSPIVLKHDPQMLGIGGSAKRIEGLSDNRSQLKNTLVRVGRTDNDEEPVLQKKLKVQTFSKVDITSNPPAEN